MPLKKDDPSIETRKMVDTFFTAALEAIEHEVLDRKLPVLLLNITGMLENGDVFHIGGAKAIVGTNRRLLELCCLESAVEYIKRSV